MYLQNMQYEADVKYDGFVSGPAGTLALVYALERNGLTVKRKMGLSMIVVLRPSIDMAMEHGRTVPNGIRRYSILDAKSGHRKAKYFKGRPAYGYLWPENQEWERSVPFTGE